MLQFTSDVKQGQIAKAKYEAKVKTLRPMPRSRPEPRGRGQVFEAEAKLEASHM